MGTEVFYKNKATGP
jgi:hypothetical protein